MVSPMRVATLHVGTVGVKRTSGDVKIDGLVVAVALGVGGRGKGRERIRRGFEINRKLG